MRRLFFPSLLAAVLVSSASSPAYAEGWREVRDCVSFTFRWCQAAREGTNEVEETAVDAVCMIKLLGCVAEF